MTKKIIFCPAIFLSIYAHAGGGANAAECINFQNKEKENLNVPPCRDPVVESDLLGCGYKNKYDTRGMSDELVLQAGYCMFKKGYRSRNNPNKKPLCQTDPQLPGCREAIEKYGDIVDADSSVPSEKPGLYGPLR